jgi:hypothetical protein
MKGVGVLALLALASALTASAEQPPTCPKGSGPVKVVDAVSGTRAPKYHWECQEGYFWPTGMFLEESDCPKGTHLEQSREDVCVPPAPRCGPRSAPLLDPLIAAGWLCDPQQDCPPGTAAGWSPIQGWQCEPLGHKLDCPKGTKFVAWEGVAVRQLMNGPADHLRVGNGDTADACCVTLGSDLKNLTPTRCSPKPSAK